MPKLLVFLFKSLWISKLLLILFKSLEIKLLFLCHYQFVNLAIIDTYTWVVSENVANDKLNKEIDAFSDMSQDQVFINYIYQILVFNDYINDCYHLYNTTK